MNVFLMFKDRNFETKKEFSSIQKDLIQDLELNVVFETMAKGDELLFDTAQKTLLFSVNDADTILYRQNILKDCLSNADVIESIYNIAQKAIKEEKESLFGFFSKYPDSIVYSSTRLLNMFSDILLELKNVGSKNSYKFQSEGFKAFFSMLRLELNDEYFETLKNNLKELEFNHGILFSAQLGKNNEGVNYTLRKLKYKKQNLIERILSKGPDQYTFYIDERDEGGFRALSELKNRGFKDAAGVLVRSVNHILNFFYTLRTELSFYIGCMNLYEQLKHIPEHVCFPIPAESDKRIHSFESLYDISLSLTKKERVVDNDLNSGNRSLFIITGANQGGKSTFLRSIGLAQIMMQCGMFVPAKSFSANICESIFTHYEREEDPNMVSGKFDEELSRMSSIVDNIRKNSMILFNESFASTNDMEASEIAKQITGALLETGVKIFFVTHLYEFGLNFYDRHSNDVMFLKAERKDDGKRTFKIVQGMPLQTSFGMDLYQRIFKNKEHLSNSND